MNREEWRDVIGYNGRYEISDMGRIRSRVRHDGKKASNIPPHYLTPHPTRDGYLIVKLTLHGRTSTRTIASLVADAFIPAPRHSTFVARPIDGDMTNCRADNLRWMPRQGRRHA